MSGDCWKCKTGLRKVSAAGITFVKDGREMLVCYCIVLPLEGTLEYMEYGSSVNFGFRLIFLKIVDSREFLFVWIIYCCLLYLQATLLTLLEIFKIFNSFKNNKAAT